jgi:hypothetical protein
MREELSTEKAMGEYAESFRELYQQTYNAAKQIK